MKLFPLLYSNQDILYIKNKDIREYDIINGGYSISIHYNLLTDDEQELLSNQSKHDKHVYLGNKAKEDKEFTEKLHRGFRESVSRFIAHNEISESNILSIKKDSLTFYGGSVKHLEFNNIKFSNRLSASSYLNVNKKEFFYSNKSDVLQVKGIDKELILHSELVNEIKNLLKLAEYKGSSFIFNYLKEMRKEYLSKNLNHTFYKELSANNGYKLVDVYNNSILYLDDITDDEIDSLDIQYNYIEYILPIIKILT